MTPIPSSIHSLAKRLWDYHRMNQPLEPADAILVLCSYDKRVAERAAQLWLDGWAPLLIFSGGLGVITRTLWTEPEADQFAQIARQMGVPSEAILIENQSTNTGENVQFTRQLLKERGLDPERFLLVQKPYMERRSYATFCKVWPEKPVRVTSPQASYEAYLDDYSNPDLSPDYVISIMVGDLQRIREYPQKGFQIPQEIPADVWEAYEKLIAAGYDQHLIRE
ncbi:YdcF family protein [Larkinella sp. VNQ87]|uniref:YdcF family protein n=1 Tax=Larkinella sp. VNQ87 TaxID=3400921 RepID=UPI003BFE5603